MAQAATDITHDENRPGYCWAYQLSYTREKNGRRTKSQDGSRFYARQADAEAAAEKARKRKDTEADWIYGPETVRVERVRTAVECVEWSERLSDERLSVIVKGHRAYGRTGL